MSTLEIRFDALELQRDYVYDSFLLLGVLDDRGKRVTDRFAGVDRSGKRTIRLNVRSKSETDDLVKKKLVVVEILFKLVYLSPRVIFNGWYSKTLETYWFICQVTRDAAVR